jgi:hypothetical protein
MTVNAPKYLTGRIFIFHLFPFDFEEFLSYKEQGYGNILNKKNAEFRALAYPEIVGEEADEVLRKRYEEYARFGGYPRVVLAKDEEEKKEVLKNIYNTLFSSRGA